MNKTQTAGLRYAELGFSVIPLLENDKKPAIAWTEYQTKRATDVQIANWFDSNLNIGIITGQISGITVVDLDIKHGLSPIFNLLPKTKVVQTPSGGYHFYYKYSPKVITTADYFKDNTGVDIRNDGGYVVAMPSTVNGNQYKVVNNAEIADFPEHLFNKVQQTKKEVINLVGVSEGGRNQSMASLIGTLLKVTPREKWQNELFQTIQQINKTYNPPLDLEELETTYKSICNRELLSIEAKNDGQSNEVREFLSTIDVKDLENIDDAKVKNSFLAGLSQYAGDDQVISSAEIIEQIKQEGETEKFYTSWNLLDAIIGGFSPGQVIVLSAPTKNGKTTWSMALTENMKKYAPCWFPFEESAHELVSKYLERGQEPPLFYVPKALVDNKLEWIEMRIIESLVKNNSRIFFIDQLDWLTNEKQFLGPEINNIMKGLKRIAKTWNIVIILMAHITKLDPELQPTMNDLRDSGNIANKCDTLIMLWRHTKRENGQLVISSNVVVSVQLNRRTGKTGNVRFVYRDGRFLEDDWDIQVAEPIKDSENF